ncbi:MFS transporter [Terriglobus roseus]|uniref:Predicted arabinose efflux permease, MFS family n=1 Tax=Terriglobus roseus TaxID=392734 RepID=A0A1G7NBG8_9BACT|nr:MFS transporter [Terriglobus roseus]SDF71302.1 Predicted arabinose efflux permease, MFS family [Terriglobus roseus]
MQHDAPSTHPKAHLGFLGLCCGVGVSTIYLCQPLLPEMGATFGADAAAAGQVGVATQVGYAIGMLTVTPLGDIRERRGMIQRMFGLVAVALLLQACAPSLPLLLLLSATSGFMACVTHLVLPIAPDLAAPEERGKAIGAVMTGLLSGVLLGRTFAGWLSEGAAHLTHRVASWRVVFAVAALVSAALVPLVGRMMPELPPKSTLTYPQAMRSLWELLREEPLLRESCWMGALCFGAFSAFWNTFAFVMESHGLGAAVTGSFGLVATAGALGATVWGRMADRKGPRHVLSIGVALMAAAYLSMYLVERYAVRAQAAGHLHVILYLLSLGFAVIWMDVGMQGMQIGNQARNFALRPEARARLNTIYMTAYFIGGSIASAFSPVLWQHFGAAGITTLEFVVIALAVLRHVTGKPIVASSETAPYTVAE